MNPLKKIVLIIFLTSFISACQSQSKSIVDLEQAYPIIPTPQNIKYGSNEVFFESIDIASDVFPIEESLLKTFFNSKGIKSSASGLKIQFLKQDIPNTTNSEAYELSIRDKITIKANSSKGAFYGIQSLKQLFRLHNEAGSFPELEITDWPAFEIRGFMHDTGRNFQSVVQLKAQIEVLAQYKYNVFHWHLTDNPGWRLESKLYPELQSETATTRQKGKFYSHADFKEILDFCKDRHITLIPELDIPGHTEAFRKALHIKTMKDKKVQPILLELFKELMALADANEMPYIHIGTDEVRVGKERVSNAVILSIMNLIKATGREVIVWKEGIEIKEDATSINQLWASHEPREGHRFIDSRSNYINHLDPFAGMARLYFQQPCRQEQGDELALGGILCAWPDNNITDEKDILNQNPIYPSMVFYADAIWKGRDKDYLEYWAKLPVPNTNSFDDFEKFETKVISHRNLFFKGKAFPYVKQTDISWKLIGPFNHHGNVDKQFPVENNLKESYQVNGETFNWTNSQVGGTIHLKHFFGFPTVTEAKTGTFYAYTNIYAPNDRVQDFWVGFQGWSRSGRRGGPTPAIGQWHTTNPNIWVNGNTIEPPIWKQPNLGTKTDEIPFVDEDYFFRTPTKINLKKGWNTVLLKIPQDGNSWKWMFTCIPIQSSKNGVSEVDDLIFKTDFDNN